MTLDPDEVDATSVPPLPDAVSRLIYRDMVDYLPGAILVKLDRATMAASLEARSPFLDHRMVEFAWRLPPHFKIRGRETKWLLRQVLYRHVPRAIVDRPKMGFGVPLAGWLRGPLRDWAEALLDPARLVREGYLAPEPIRQRWTEHVQGRHNWEMSLWNVLMFQVWMSNERSAGLTPTPSPAAVPTPRTVPLPI